MRNWRSMLFWGILALVAVELCFVVGFYFHDGQIKHVSTGIDSVAIATSAPPGAQLDVASAAPASSTRATDMPASTAPATDSPTSKTSRFAATRAPAIAAFVVKTIPKQRPHLARVVVADSTAFRYEGRWEHIAGKNDGRMSGKSSRTFAKGARATLAFSGRFVRLYGVLGPGGGFGAIRLDGGRAEIVDFFAASKAAHRLIYSSPMLPAGDHRVSLIVVPDPKIASARTQYVNIDGAEYGT